MAITRGVNKLGDAPELGVIAVLGGTIAQQLLYHEQRGMRSGRVTTRKRGGGGGGGHPLPNGLGGGTRAPPRGTSCGGHHMDLGGRSACNAFLASRDVVHVDVDVKVESEKTESPPT